jgi:release factor glutamine methyltransferase
LSVAEALSQSGIDPREARLLLAQASGFSEASVLAFPERQLPSEVERRYRESVSRRREGEPVAYIIGRKEFYGLDLAVNPAVLIPRPETELLVDLALERDFSSLVDLGTGSGAIAIAVKRQRPAARVVAVEASAAALVVARRNATRHSLEIDFRHGLWCEALGNERFALILANPPYIAAGDSHLGDLRFEPPQALVSGADGLDDLRQIAGQAPGHLSPGGWLLLEHGLGQEAVVRALLEKAGLESVSTWPDLAGIPRVTGGKR